MAGPWGAKILLSEVPIVGGPENSPDAMAVKQARQMMEHGDKLLVH
jgi:hypothetical protein